MKSWLYFIILMLVVIWAISHFKKVDAISAPGVIYLDEYKTKAFVKGFRRENDKSN